MLLGVLTPIGGEKTGERCNEDHTSRIGNGGCELADLVTVATEPQIVHEKLDARSRNGDGTFERIEWGDTLRAEIEGDGSEETVFADYGLFADVVEKETPCSVGILRAARGEPALADERSRLIAKAAGDLCAFEGSAGEFAVFFGV